MTYEYTLRYIPVKKKGWQELGEAMEDLPVQGWELFMAVPITKVSAYWFGLSGGRTAAIIHYFRRPQG
jgi:hypothetical protein